MKRPVNIREIALFGISLFLAFFLIRGCDTPLDKSQYIPKELFDASQDSMHKFRNGLGQEETKTKLLYGSISDLKKLGASKDSSIQKLLKLVNKKTIGATVISNVTSSTVSSSTTVTSKDTIRKDSLIYIYPVYTLKPSVSRWDSVSATASKDSFNVFFRVYNEYSITQEFEKQKVKGRLFRQKVPVIKVVNLNPKTETRELKSFTVQPPKQKKGIIFTTGILLGIILKQTLLK